MFSGSPFVHLSVGILTLLPAETLSQLDNIDVDVAVDHTWAKYGSGALGKITYKN